jgi:hypothetical protein
VVDAGRRDVGADLLDHLLRGARERQLLDVVGREQLVRALDVAGAERVHDRLQVGGVDPVAGELLRRHRRDVERDEQPRGVLCGR